LLNARARDCCLPPPSHYKARLSKNGLNKDVQQAMVVQQSQAGASPDVTETVRRILADVLALNPATAASLNHDSPLFGALPELDSMAVAGLLTEIEDRLGIVIDDDDVDADLFATFGSLVSFAQTKVAA